MNKYLKKMLYALTSAYSRKDYDNLQSGKPIETNIGKLFSIFAWGLDMVQEQADLIKLWDDLDYAEGKVLDRYGANFGVKRGGASDPLYRLFIKVKMIAQLSSGDEDTVIKAAAEFLGVEYTELESEDVYPAKKWIYVDFTRIPEERLKLIEQIAHAIKRTIAAGVGFRLYLRTYRTYRAELRITYGGFLYAADIGTDVGARRTEVSLLDILHAGRIWTWHDGDIPPNVPRSYDLPLDVTHGGFLEREIEGYYPDSQSTSTSRLDISRGANIERHIDTMMPDSHKALSMDASIAYGGFLEHGTEGYYPDSQSTSTSRLDISRGANIEHHVETAMPDSHQTLELDASVAHGGFLRDERTSILPDSKRTFRGDSGASGAMCVTRVKPRRID